MPPKRAGFGTSRGGASSVLATATAATAGSRKKRRAESDEESEEEVPYDDESPPMSEDGNIEDAEMEDVHGSSFIEEPEVKRTPAKKGKPGIGSSPNRGVLSTSNLPGGLTPAQQQQALNELYKSIPTARWQQIAQTIAKIKGDGRALAATPETLVPLMKELHSKGQLPFPLPVPGAPIFPIGTMPSPLKHENSNTSLPKGTPSLNGKAANKVKEESAPPVKDEASAPTLAQLAAMGVRQSSRARKMRKDYIEDAYLDTLLTEEEQRIGGGGRTSLGSTPAPQSAIDNRNNQVLSTEMEDWPLPTRVWPRTKKTAIKTPVVEVQWVLPNPPNLAFGPDYIYSNPSQLSYTYQNAGGSVLGHLGGVNMMMGSDDNLIDGDFNPRRLLSRSGRASNVDMSLSALRVQKKPRIKWTDDEVAALEEGMMQHGTRWSAIEALHGKNGTGRLGNRDQVQLKDKARVEKARRIKLGLSLGPFERASN